MASTTIPAYCFFDEIKFSQYISGFNIRDSDSLLIFFQICRLIRISGKNKLQMSALQQEVMQWAERENHPQFKNADATKQVSYSLLYRLRDNYLAELDTTGQEIQSVVLHESEYYQIYQFYYNYNFNQSKTGYPDVADLYSGNYSAFVDRIKLDNLNLSEMTLEKRGPRLVQLEFSHSSSTLLFPGDHWDLLEKVARNKVHSLVLARFFARDLDQIIRLMRNESGMEFITEKIIQDCVEGEKENSAVFFELLYNSLLDTLLARKDLPNQDELLKSVAILLKTQQHKAIETEKQLESENKKHDKDQLFRFLRRKRSFFTLNDIHQIFEELDFQKSLSTTYSALDWDRLVEEFIEEIVEHSDSNSEDGLFKIEINSGVSYMFIDYYIENVVHLREEFSPRAKDFLYNAWLARRIEREQVHEYNSATVLEKSLNDWVQGNIPKLGLLLNDDKILQKSILTVQDKSQRKALFETLWNHQDNCRQLWAVVFCISIKELISEVEAAVPISSKFLILRLFKSFILFLKGDFKKKANNKIIDSGEIIETGTIENVAIQKAELIKGINDLQVGILENKKYDRVLEDLESVWNVKLGPVRKQFRDEINNFIRAGARNRFNMLRNMRGSQLSFLLNEIENLSHEAYAKFQNEIHSEKIFLKYAKLFASGIFRTLAQKMA
jgi:hypothetical protein